MMEMEDNAFASLALLQFSLPSRLLPSACCPDKDLVVVISRLGGKDRMSLWKMQGPKKWEIDFETAESGDVVDVAWSPSGQTIAVAHDPPCITLHSVQDGREERRMPILPYADPQTQSFRASGIWWFQEKRVAASGPIPDIFKRKGIITGSALSILKTLPLLDALHNDHERSTATDIFAFQGTQTKPAAKHATPNVIDAWPTLVPDLNAASISSASHEGQSSSAKDAEDELRDADDNSILALADDSGRLSFFLDGSYHLGSVSLGSRLSGTTLSMHPTEPLFFAHPQLDKGSSMSTPMQPVVVELPLLATRKVRDAAKLSSAARELIWYIMRCVQDMRAAWYGSDTTSGARELGPRWVSSLESKLKDSFGEEKPDVILDLTCLLATGNCSEGIADFFGSSEQMSERALTKWESTLTDALHKLRDFCGRKVAFAFQRLHVVLEEIRGYSQLQNYAVFDINTNEINFCLESIQRGIIITSWLAATARLELCHFREFLSFLRREIAAATAPAQSTESPPPINFDVLEVNNYLISGLTASSIDRWFEGPVPYFHPEDLGGTGEAPNLQATLERAAAALKDPHQTAWQSGITRKDLSHVDRNLDALVQDLASRCERVFAHASSAAGRSAIVSAGLSSYVQPQVASARPVTETSDRLFIRQRVVEDKNQPGKFLQFLAIHMSSEDRSFLCITRMSYGMRASQEPVGVGIALLECRAVGNVGNDSVDLDLLDADFFDEELVVIIYKERNGEGPRFIGTMNYNDLGFQEMQSESNVSRLAREDLVADVLQRWSKGHYPTACIPIKRRRELGAAIDGSANISVNGRAGRRIVCVLDGKGKTMEILDMEGEEGTEMDEDAGLGEAGEI